MSRDQVQRQLKRGQRVLAFADVDNPQAWAICDGCGFRVMHNSLKRQVEYRGGSAPVWTGFLVCGRCLDVPQPYFSRQVLPPDPVPVQNPRPGQNPTFRITLQDGTSAILTEDGAVLTQDS